MLLLGVIIQHSRTDFCSDEHPGNVCQVSERGVRGQFYRTEGAKMLHPLDVCGIRTCLEADMHSCAPAQRLLHRFTLLDTSLDVLEAGAKLGYCSCRITHQKPHMMAIFTQLSGNRSPNGAGGSND
jgi:hypothetical protein